MNQGDNYIAISGQPSKRCIWMTAGVISYKLCPLRFDCDNCEFHAAIRKRQSPGERTEIPPQSPTGPDTQ